MAIEIIPKPPAKIPFWLNILLYFSIILLIFSISSYFVLDYYLIKKSEITLQDLEKEIEEKKSEKKALEEEILNYQKKIEDFSFLLDQHLVNLNFFNFFEKISHPKVWFSDFNSIPGEAKIKVSGQAESFQVLGQQLLIFKAEPLIENLNLSEISLGEEGKIKFTFNLILSPQIFTPQL